MKYFQKTPIDQFVRNIIQKDHDTVRLIESWNMENDEIISLIVEHFREYGVFMVHPVEHARVIYRHIHQQIAHSPKLWARRKKIQADIDRAKAKHARHEE